MNYRKIFIIAVISLLTCTSLLSQEIEFTHADTLIGSNGSGRNFWDVLRYDITVNPDFNTQSIIGKNNMYLLLHTSSRLQIDLQEPMILDSALVEGNNIPITREGNVYWLDLPKAVSANSHYPIKVILSLYFHGSPRVSTNPPWDGGWIWTTDQLNRPWMTVVTQSTGASLWYPCKDYQGDKPDQGATLRIVVPDSLVGVGNGRLISVSDTLSNKKVYTWKVVNPINNYCITPYIGKYVHWHEGYQGLKGNLDLDYWVIPEDSAKAVKQFKEVPRMLKAFEYWLGPYPFYEDSYKLVQTSYLGMEHQSAIAYGNHFENGYLGEDWSGSGWGLKWDFIIVHESGHEWFGNSITSIDVADMWIHEGFTNYTESLFTEYYYGKKAGSEYVRGMRARIKNDRPVTGVYGVRNEGSGDMYYKGSNMIHLIRKVINNDKVFRNMLIEMGKKFYHQSVTAKQVEELMITYSGRNLQPIFNQYLKTTLIPVFEYEIINGEIKYHFTHVVDGFQLNLPVYINGRVIRLNVSAKWKSQKIRQSSKITVMPDPDYLILTKQKVSGKRQ